MRFQKRRVVIALFGQSCTGKTRIADAIGSLLNVPVRHCSEEVKRRALESGVSVENLEVSVHRAVDQETQAAVEAKEVGVVEGSYLDCVLGGWQGMLFVKLTCNGEERTRRHLERGATTSESLRERDAREKLERHMLYGDCAQKPHFTVDTTKRTVEKCARKVVSLVES